MQFALLIYESPEAFAARKSDGTNSYIGAWRAYHKALVESGALVAGDPLKVTGNGNHHTNSGWKARRSGRSICRH